MTREEYEDTFVRIMDSLRLDTEYVGERNCKGVDCSKCPLAEGAYGCYLFNAGKAIEIAEKWSKEHPLVTRADKFEEVFGYKPMYKDGRFMCPSIPDCSRHHSCALCKSEFWKAEYEVPKGE